METKDLKLNESAEGDDDDCGNYFLQPANSPYNIAEKVKEANEALFTEELNTEDKQFKVKFREDLVDYEPEQSYDDASSIESEDNIDYTLAEQDATILEKHLENTLILNVYNSDEEIEEIIENIEESPEETATIVSEPDVNFNVRSEIHTQVNEVKTNFNQYMKHNLCKNVNKNMKNIFNRKIQKTENISCERHCIDSVDRFDFNANISITKMNLIDKPFPCPRLKLQRRNCCEKNEIKFHQKLPYYTGLRSEYGLNEEQLQRREKIKEIIKLKNQERQRVLEESKRRRTEQNEQIFCEWLKAVSHRKTQHKKNAKINQSLPSTVLMFSGNHTDAAKQRPKTATQIYEGHVAKKKRPHTTSSACIFIEVPPKLLQKGISVGDLLVTKSSSLATKKLHVLALT